MEKKSGGKLSKKALIAIIATVVVAAGCVAGIMIHNANNTKKPDVVATDPQQTKKPGDEVNVPDIVDDKGDKKDADEGKKEKVKDTDIDANKTAKTANADAKQTETKKDTKKTSDTKASSAASAYGNGNLSTSQVMALQGVLGVAQDGDAGAQTYAAMKDMGYTNIDNAYKDLVEDAPSSSTKSDSDSSSSKSNDSGSNKSDSSTQKSEPAKEPSKPKSEPKPEVYDCGYPNHSCANSIVHKAVMRATCEYCGQSGSDPNCTCPAVLGTGDCPKYSAKKDASVYCQTCGRKLVPTDNANKKGVCASTWVDWTCKYCGKHVDAWECHCCG